MGTDDTIIANIGTINNEDASKKPCLTFITGPRLGQIYDLDKLETIVGRSPDCELWIEDSAISRKHFKIKLEDGLVELEDCGSTNGTYVNGQRIKTALLNDGDRIQISKETILELTFLDETRILSERKRYEMGVMDPVTNIYNKRYLLDRLKEEFSFAKRRNRSMSVVIFDLDHFKSINDQYGHLAGDVVLQKICVNLMKTIRSDDVFARYGGEEFVVLMRDADTQSAMNLAERLRKMTEDLNILHDGVSIKVTISLGVATLINDMNSYLDLISIADKYLYQSKESGRNRVTGPSVDV